MSISVAPPRPVHPLRGRDTEYQGVYDRLAARGGLVTLSGMGGVGKSRLAAEVARTWLEDRHRVVWVALDATRQEHEVVTAVANALEVERPRDIPLQLGAEPRTLLVLDNLEQLDDPSFATIAGWVRDALSLRVLTTSRRRLRVPEEEAFELLPLGAPGVDGVLSSAAWSILTDHAGPQAAGVSAVDAAQLVHATDGLPLALELAAARFEVLSPDGVLERSAWPLGLLADPDRPEHRHGSIRRTLAWSWSLLSEADARTLARLSVCRAPFDLDAAEAIAAVDGEVFDTLHRAVRAHLLVRDEATYRMLVNPRAFANEQLSETERAEAERCHTHHFGAAARAWAALGASRPAPPGLRAELTAIVDRGPTTHAEVPWAVEAGFQLCDSYRLLGAVAAIPDIARRCLSWPATDHPEEAYARAGLHCLLCDERRANGDHAGALQRYTSIEMTDAWPTWIRGWVLQGIAVCQAMLGNVTEGIATLETADGLPDLDSTLRVELQGRRASWLMFVGRREESVALCRQIYEACRTMDPHPATIAAFRELGGTLATVDLDLAETVVDQAIGWANAIAGPQFQADLRSVRGSLRLLRGDLDAAEAEFRWAIEVLHEGGHLSSAAPVSVDLARVRSTRGHWAEVRDLVEPALPHLGAHYEDQAKAVLAVAGAVLGAPQEDTSFADHTGGELVSILADGFRGSQDQARDAVHAATRATPGADPNVTGIDHALWLDACLQQLEQRARAWHLSSDGTWAAPPDGPRVDLSKRKAYSRILATLVACNQSDPSTSLSAPALFSAGWPGEHAGASSLRNRVHVAISTLRKLGLAPLVERHAGGWRLSPEVPVMVDDTR